MRHTFRTDLSSITTSYCMNTVFGFGFLRREDKTKKENNNITEVLFVLCSAALVLLAARGVLGLWLRPVALDTLSRVPTNTPRQTKD